MKKFLSLIFLTLVISACSVGDDSLPTIRYSLLAIESVEIADIYPVNETSEIMITYKRPTDCYIFDGFYIQSEAFTNIIAVKSVQMIEDDCIEDVSTFTVPLEFKPTVEGEYLLKFYAGNPGNVPQYLEYSVIVE